MKASEHPATFFFEALGLRSRCHFQCCELHIPTHDDGIHVRVLLDDIRRRAHVELLEEWCWQAGVWNGSSLESLLFVWSLLYKVEFAMMVACLFFTSFTFFHPPRLLSSYRGPPSFLFEKVPVVGSVRFCSHGLSTRCIYPLSTSPGGCTWLTVISDCSKVIGDAKHSTFFQPGVDQKNLPKWPWVHSKNFYIHLTILVLHLLLFMTCKIKNSWSKQKCFAWYIERHSGVGRDDEGLMQSRILKEGSRGVGCTYSEETNKAHSKIHLAWVKKLFFNLSREVLAGFLVGSLGYRYWMFARSDSKRTADTLRL